MISKFRKGADTLFVRILLGLIALSFVAIGGTSFIKSNSTGDIITFSGTDSISFEKFQSARAQEIDFIQKQNGIHLTEENIAEMGLDNIVFKKLINNSMISYLAKYYEFDISDEKVISFVKDTPFFKNSKGEFDLSIFKSVFNNSQAKEEEYLVSMKHRLITSVMQGIFKESFYTPKILKDTIVNYMAETRTIDLFSIDLTHKPSDYQPNNYSQEELKQFYNDNKALFVVPEIRSFEYIKADKKFLEKKLTINEKELKNYFEENKDEFKSKKFSEVKKQIKDLLHQEKLLELNNELAKHFEEDVSSGLTFKEIATKYDLPIINVKDLSLSKMSDNANEELAELADNVFEMAEGEVSYPIEIQSTSAIILVNLKSIVQARQQEFKEVEKILVENIEKRDLEIYNMKNFKEIIKISNLDKLDKINLSSKGITHIPNLEFTRANPAEKNKIPAELISAIFKIEPNNYTNIINSHNKAYLAYLKRLENNKIVADKIRKNDGQHISNVIKQGIFGELIDYLTHKNNMKVKVK